MSEHPKYYVALCMRTKRRTLNLAVALLGRSTGWGRPGKPRRTFVGHNPTRPYHRGVELKFHSGDRERQIFAIKTGSGSSS